MNGLCRCGCGNLVSIAKRTDKRRNHIKGKPIRFICGHNSYGENNHNWKGMTTYSIENYRLLVEKIIGKSLPIKAEIHHLNGKRYDNKNQNLIVCENRSYHMVLHYREKAFKTCGHAHWRKCKHCQKYDLPENLYIYMWHVHHRSCENKYQKERRTRCLKN